MSNNIDYKTIVVILVSEIKKRIIMETKLISIFNLFSLTVESYNNCGVFHSIVIFTACLPYNFISSIGDELGLIPLSISALDGCRFQIIFRS